MFHVGPPYMDGQCSVVGSLNTAHFHWTCLQLVLFPVHGVFMTATELYIQSLSKQKELMESLLTAFFCQSFTQCLQSKLQG